MKGTEIISLLANNISTISSAVSAVTGGLFTAIFLRHNTATKEFEKIKAGQFREVADELLRSGEMTHTEFYKANNFLTVAKKADEYYSKMPKRDNFDAYDFDWFIRFYEAVGNISNEEMQDLWAKILAGEISHPSTYSLRTIDILKNLNKADAILFERICMHSICSGERTFLPRYDKYLDEVQIEYDDIMHLSELGLMYNDSLIVLKIKPQKGVNILLANRNLIMTYSVSDESKNTFKINQYPFTQVGKEIASLKGYCTTDDNFLLFAKEVEKNNANITIQVHGVTNVFGGQIQYENINLLADDSNIE